MTAMTMALRRLAIILALVGLVACETIQPTEPPDTAPAEPSCTVARVVDGDTLDMACPGQGAFRARLVGFDTPEVYSPACAAEYALGSEASRRMRALVHGATTIHAEMQGFDRYDRRLVRLRLDGADVARVMIAEGLAVPYAGGRRTDWCRRLA